MKRRNATRSALFTSIVSLLLCVSMLVGTTFAWFTDSVVSGTNTIAAGNLDVELYHSDKDNSGYVDVNTKLFNDVTLWEPGAVVYENFVVENKGSLALKYQLALNFENATQTPAGKTLADVLKVAVVPGGFSGDREAAKGLAYNYSLATFALEGKLESAAVSDTYGIVIYWQPGSNDNDFNMNNGQSTVLSIDLGVNLFATQLEAESDSFGKDYDAGADALIPEIDNTFGNVKEDGSASFDLDAAPAAGTNKTTVDAPVGAFAPTDKVEVDVTTTNTLFNVTAGGSVIASLDVTMTVNGEETSADLTDGKVYTVTTYISKGLTDVTVDYIGTDGKDEPTNVSYDAVTGKLTFQTNHFSQYAVSGKALAFDTKNDTALSEIQQVIEANKDADTTVVIPEANKEIVAEKIEESLPEEEKEEALGVIADAKIDDKSYTTLRGAFEAAQAGETIVLLKNVQTDADTTILVNKQLVLDLNGKTLAGISTKTGANRIIINVTKDGDLLVKNGTVTMEHTGANMNWNNSISAIEAVSTGKLTLDHVTVVNKGGSDMAYAVNIGNNGGATLKTVASTLESKNYSALRIFNNADGDINVDLTEGTVLTGSGSPFFVHFWTDADLGAKKDARQSYLHVNFNDTEVSRYSGSKSLIRFGFTDAVYYSDTAMTEVVAANSNALVDALENNKNVLLNNDVKIDPANMSNAYGKTGINVKNGQTINGNGFTLDIKEAGGTWDSGINTTGGLIKNLTVTGSFRGIFINHNSTHSEKVVLENVIIDGTTYTISCDQGTNQGLEATSSTFNGWTSYAATLGEAKFVGCSFGEGNGYAYCRPYAPTEFVGCDFEEGYKLDPRAAVTFENCTINGEALTAENLSVLVTGNIANATVK